MKWKIGDRILLIIFVLIVMLLSLILLGISVKVIPIEIISSALFNSDSIWPAVILAAIAVVLFIMGLRLIVACLVPPKSFSTILANTELGVIRVSVTTLDTLTQKAVRNFQDVKDVKSLVLPNQDGASIQLKITVLTDVSIPELTQSIQTKVKEYVESVSGIPVKEVQIYIENLSVEKAVRVE